VLDRHPVRSAGLSCEQACLGEEITPVAQTGGLCPALHHRWDPVYERAIFFEHIIGRTVEGASNDQIRLVGLGRRLMAGELCGMMKLNVRSEERRVGKECRCGWQA